MRKSWSIEEIQSAAERPLNRFRHTFNHNEEKIFKESDRNKILAEHFGLRGQPFPRSVLAFSWKFLNRFKSRSNYMGTALIFSIVVIWCAKIVSHNAGHGWNPEPQHLWDLRLWINGWRWRRRDGIARMKAIMRLIQKLEIGDISKEGKGKFI